MPFNPDKPLTVSVCFQSPTVTSFHGLYRRPGERAWTTFADARDSDSTHSSEHHYSIPPLPPETTVRVGMAFHGDANNPYKATIDVTQAVNGSVLSVFTRSFRGILDESHFAVEVAEVALI